MSTQLEPDTPASREQQADLAHEQWQSVSMNLKATRKVLKRDWPNLTPRQRSEYSRLVKEMEQQEQTLRETIEMNGSD